MKQTQRKQDLAAKVAKTAAINAAIVSGLERGDKTFTKIHDRAMSVRVELERAGITFNLARRCGVCDRPVNKCPGGTETNGIYLNCAGEY